VVILLVMRGIGRHSFAKIEEDRALVTALTNDPSQCRDYTGRPSHVTINQAAVNHSTADPSGPLNSIDSRAR
jgi:hypothetical protein